VGGKVSRRSWLVVTWLVLTAALVASAVYMLSALHGNPDAVKVVEPVRVPVRIASLTGNVSVRGYLVVADTEELQRVGYGLVREGDVGVLFIFRDLPRVVCFRNPFNFSIYMYILTRSKFDFYGSYVHTLLSNTTWCAVLVEGEMVLETRLRLPADVFVFRT